MTVTVLDTCFEATLQSKCTYLLRSSIKGVSGGANSSAHHLCRPLFPTTSTYLNMSYLLQEYKRKENSGENCVSHQFHCV